MKNKLRNIIIIPVIFLLTACGSIYQQYAIDSSMLTVEANLLKLQYTKVETILRQLQEDKHLFTDDEWNELLNVDSTIDMLIARIDGIIQFQSSEISLMDVQFMWGLAVEGYTKARTVISAHKDEIPPSSWALLDAFDTQAEMTNARIDKLLNDPSNSNITEALTLITGVIGIAVKMLGVAII